MKTLKLSSLLAILLVSPLFGAGDWHTDFDAAKTLAAKEGKDLLVDFTGSDWCGWCIKLRKEVFDQEAFKKGVFDHFVLVELDFPRDRSKLSKETRAQNEQLKNRFAIRGFPTILLCDAEGRPYARTGYQPGGGEKYLAHLKTLKTQHLAEGHKPVAKPKDRKAAAKAPATPKNDAVPAKKIRKADKPAGKPSARCHALGGLSASRLLARRNRRRRVAAAKDDAVVVAVDDDAIFVHEVTTARVLAP